MMRKVLGVALMLVPLLAWAGDKLLGVILVTDAGTANNANTGYLSAGCSAQTALLGAGACAQAFAIGAGGLLSIQCKDQSAVIAVNQPAVDAGNGIKLAADQFLTSSSSFTPFVVPPKSSVALWGMPDGGTYVGGVVSIAPIAGAARAECNVYLRQGNE